MSNSSGRILVTGGAGFIGSHIVERLIKEDCEVGVIDNLSTGSESNIATHIRAKKVRLFNCDISDFAGVSEIVQEYETIIHEAALVSVSRSVEDPATVNSVNVDGSLNLLKAAVDSKVQKFIFASSSSVYGDSETLPKKESMTTNPISPYGVSKLTAENYCTTFARVYGLKTVSLRYFNVYGPRQKSGPYSGVIPIFVKKVLSGEAPAVNGDGNQIRDFTYVDDVVQANILCLKKSVRPGEVYNVAAGKTISINDLASRIIELVGKSNLVPVHGPERNGDIRASYADITKISHDLGYKPRFTMKEGLEKVIDWFLSGNQAQWN